MNPFIFAAILCLSFVSLNACTTRSGIGDRCFETRECKRGICAHLADSPSICLLECGADDLFCEDGEACVKTENEDAFVCLEGGDVEIGDPCEGSVECEFGAICVDASCAQLCEPPGPGPYCTGGEVCTTLPADPDRGFCEPP